MRRIVKRLGRSGVATAISVVSAHFGQNPYFLAAGPLLAAIAKGLREKDVEKWGWLPF
jgi:hypothetical protein